MCVLSNSESTDLAPTAFDMRYGHRHNLRHLRDRGYHGPVRTILFDYGRRMLSGYFAERFADPLAWLSVLQDQIEPCSLILGISQDTIRCLSHSMSRFTNGNAPDPSILPPGDQPLVQATRATFPNAESLYDLPSGFFCLQLPLITSGLLKWRHLLSSLPSPREQAAPQRKEPHGRPLEPETPPPDPPPADPDPLPLPPTPSCPSPAASLLTPDDELWSPLLDLPQPTSWRRPSDVRHPANFGNMVFHRPSPEHELGDADCPFRRRQPPRAARPAPGDTSSLPLVSDTVSAGKLPAAYIAPPPAAYHPLCRKHGDLQSTWIDESIFCPAAGKGFFFELLQRVPAGYLIGAYFGPNSRALGLDYKDAIRLWADSDFVLSDPTAKYAVAGSPYCGPAYSNDGFSIFNCVFLYNRTLHRMEIRTRGPMEAGRYEALVNYDIPNQLPSYWNVSRQKLLPLEARAACAFYYQSNSSRPPVSSARYVKARAKAVAKSQPKKSKGNAPTLPSDTRPAGSPAPSCPSTSTTSSRSIRSWFNPLRMAAPK